MILHVQKETMVDGFSQQLKRAGLGIMAKNGQYHLVQREAHPQIYHDVFVGPEPEQMSLDLQPPAKPSAADGSGTTAS